MKIKLILLALAGMLAAVLFTGCTTFNDNPAPNALASVVITNQPMSAIAQATATVFANHAFTGGQTGPHQFTYSRLGSRVDKFEYGSYEFNEAVTIQIVVEIQRMERHLHHGVVQGLAVVEDAGDPVFSDSHQVRELRKWPYEQLLKDIKAQLG